MYEIGIIGLGLMGGSIAKALNQNKIVAFDLNEEILKQALQEKTITDYTLEIDEKFSNVDILFVCTPVNSIYSYIEKASKFIKKDCLVTDIGSVKCEIVNKIENNFPELNFIGGHPMVGSEKIGYKFSSGCIFENTYYIITKTERTKEKPLELLYCIIEKLKAIPIIIDLKKHDFIVSITSHIPHIMAVSVVNLVKKLDDDESNMHTLTAGGFKDFTRVASSSPIIWQAICEQNKQEILKGLNEFKIILNDFEEKLMMDKNEDILDYFREVKEYRDSMN